MKSHLPLAYNEIEIRSYLPTGWGLSPTSPEGQWDAKKQSWKAEVVDGSEMSWPLEVKSSDSSSLGRMEALRLAMDRVFRHRLGTPTRGLGLG